MKLNNLSKPKLDFKNWTFRKFISLFLIIALLLNLILVFILNYSMLIFWGIIIFAFIVLQILKKVDKKKIKENE